MPVLGQLRERAKRDVSVLEITQEHKSSQLWLEYREEHRPCSRKDCIALCEPPTGEYKYPTKLTPHVLPPRLVYIEVRTMGELYRTEYVRIWYDILHTKTEHIRHGIRASSRISRREAYGVPRRVVPQPEKASWAKVVRRGKGKPAAHSQRATPIPPAREIETPARVKRRNRTRLRVPKTAAVVLTVCAETEGQHTYLCIVSLVYYFLTRNYGHWKKKGVVNPEPELFFGNARNTMLRQVTFAESAQQLYDAYPNEKIIGFYRTWTPYLIVRDLDVIKSIMISDFDNFANRGFNFSSKGLGMNLFSTDGDTWLVLRTRLSPIFTSGKLKNMFGLIDERGDEFLRHLKPLIEENSDRDIYTLVQKFTLGSISTCAFGMELDMNESDTMLAKIDSLIFKSNYTIELDSMFPGILKTLDLSFFPSIINEFFYGLVKTVTKKRNGMPSNRGDFMDLLLELRNAGQIQGSKKHENDKDRILEINDDVMAAQAFVFYAAGYETSATTLSFLLHHLALDQDIQNRVVEEINEVLSKNNGKLTYECLKEMTYMGQVFDETLRMYPVVDPLTRKALYDYKIPGTNVTLNAGTNVMVSARGIHYDEKYYPNPHKFDPERFSAENTKIRHPCAFLPFGIGPRNCIGLRFAQVQSRVCLIKLLPLYRVEPSSLTKPVFVFNSERPILGSKNGVHLRIVPRTCK
ncbi:cytochrome P450 6B5-like [Aphomia sociella]